MDPAVSVEVVREIERDGSRRSSLGLLHSRNAAISARGRDALALEALRRILRSAGTRRNRIVRSRRLDSVVDAVGNTPLVRLRRVANATFPTCEVWAKLEFANPGGSVKDRAALRMIRRRAGRRAPHAGKDPHRLDERQHGRRLLALRRGARRPRATRDAVEREQGAQGHRAQLRHRDRLQRPDGGLRRRHPSRARARRRRTPDRYFYPDQYSNPSNWRAHYDGTGREILEALGDRITHFVAGLGTTGTMMGCARRLKEHSPAHRVRRRRARRRAARARGAQAPASRAWCPPIYDPRVHDRMLRVTTEDGWDMADRLAREEGLHVGHSSGANVFARRSRSPSEAAARGARRLRRRHRVRPRRSLLRAHEVGAPVRVVKPFARYAVACDARRRRKHSAATRPWVTGNSDVPRAVIDRVDEEARRAYARDEESCGFLVGPASDGPRVDGIVPMVNRRERAARARSGGVPADRAHVLRHRLDEVRGGHPARRGRGAAR